MQGLEGGSGKAWPSLIPYLAVVPMCSQCRHLIVLWYLWQSNSVFMLITILMLCLKILWKSYKMEVVIFHSVFTGNIWMEFHKMFSAFSFLSTILKHPVSSTEIIGSPWKEFVNIHHKEELCLLYLCVGWSQLTFNSSFQINMLRLQYSQNSV